MNSGNWIIDNIVNTLNVWNDKLQEIWQIIIQSPENFKGGGIWGVVLNINAALKAIGYALLVLFFVVGIVKTCGSFAEVRRPEHAAKFFIRFILAKAVVGYGLDLMMALFRIVQGVISTTMDTAGLTAQAADFGVVVVTAIAERVVCAKCSCQGAGSGYQLAPRIVDIFYHTQAAFVHKANYIILAVSQVIVLRAVVVYGYRLPVGIVAEQQRFFRRYLRHEQTAVVAERCGHSVYCLARAYALLVIGVACGQAVAG